MDTSFQITRVADPMYGELYCGWVWQRGEDGIKVITDLAESSSLDALQEYFGQYLPSMGCHYVVDNNENWVYIGDRDPFEAATSGEFCSI